MGGDEAGGARELARLSGAARGVGYYDAVGEFEYLSTGSVAYGKRTPAGLADELGLTSGPHAAGIPVGLAAAYTDGYQSYVDEVIERLRSALDAMRESPAAAAATVTLLEDIASAERYLCEQEERLEHLPLWPEGILAASGGLRGS
jgi:hypothetical protein